MLNRFLPIDKIHENLRDYLDSWDFLLKQINPENLTSIYADSKTLAKLHHSLNVDKYQNVKFRQELFEYAPIEQITDFAKANNRTYPSFEIAQTPEYRKNLAKFTWGNNFETKSFIDIFGYEDYLLPAKLDDHESVNIIHPSDNPYKQFKDYQAQIFYETKNIIEYPNTRFLIQMPTGAGKTRVGMEIASQFLNEKKNRQVVWLADRFELCDQAVDAFENTWSHVGKHDLKLYKLWGNIDVPQNITGTCFVVGMYQKIRESLKNGTLSLKADLIITDEAHNVLARTYNETINNLRDFQNKQTRIIGLTATPGRGAGQFAENEKLANYFHNKIIKIPSQDVGVIAYLQRKKILSRCIRKPLYTNIKYKLTKEEWASLKKSFLQEYPDGLLERIANDNARNASILTRLKDLAKECKHILVFSANKKQSKLLCGLMLALDYKAVHVDGNSPLNYRRSVVQKFKNGDIQFIFNFGVFTTGFDSPNIDAVVIARPTTSVVLYGQMIGRGMRGFEIGGTEEFQLIDVVDTIITDYSGLDNVYEFFSEYWDVE